MQVRILPDPLTSHRNGELMIARLEEVATYDEDGRVEGMQFDSRERRIQQWREKKEDEEFERLIAKLRQKKKYRAWYDRHKDDPDFRERLRQHCRIMRVKHGPRRNAEARAKRLAEKKPKQCSCQECGKDFEKYGHKAKPSKFCSRSCRNRDSHKRRDKKRTSRKDEVLALVKSRYSVTAREAESQLNMSLATVRALLNVLVNSGEIKKYKDEIPFRYSIW